MGLSGSGINEENYIVSGSWIAWLIDDSIGTILPIPFCPYHFVPYHFVLEPIGQVARIRSEVFNLRSNWCHVCFDMYRYVSSFNDIMVTNTHPYCWIQTIENESFVVIGDCAQGSHAKMRTTSSGRLRTVQRSTVCSAGRRSTSDAVRIRSASTDATMSERFQSSNVRARCKITSGMSWFRLASELKYFGIVVSSRLGRLLAFEREGLSLSLVCNFTLFGSLESRLLTINSWSLVSNAQ